MLGTKLGSLLAILLFLSCESGAEPLVLVSPNLDRSDRIDRILDSATPSLSVQRVFLEGRATKPGSWYRMLGDRRPVALGDAKLVILENAPASALERVTTGGGRPLLDALPGWVDRGGRLLVVGGWPSQESYRGTPLDAILPARPSPDPGLEAFRKRRRLVLEGEITGGLYVEHLHPVEVLRGKTKIRAGTEPFAVHGTRGMGEVLQILSGDHQHFHADGADNQTFFSSSAWAELLLDYAGEALGTTYTLHSPLTVSSASPAVRSGAMARPADWFPVGEGKRIRQVSLEWPPGTPRFTATPGPDGRVRLPEQLRPGIYSARWLDGSREHRARVLVGLAPDPSRFDIRYFSMGHIPYPFGLAPGEAYDRAREISAAGITSVVYPALKKRPKNDLRALRELAAAGMEIVYYSTTRYRSGFPRWRYGGQTPTTARNHLGQEVGWDIHGPEFRAGIGHIFDGFEEVLSLPGLRALQMVEELRDADLQGATLRDEVRLSGLQGDEKPGQPEWFRHEEIRSRLTGETLRRYREVGNGVLPGVRQSGYWPGSYWQRRAKYALRVPELVSSVDELLGPGYGYNYGRNPDAGWVSVVDTAAEIFGAMNHQVAKGKGFSVYALGRPLSPNGTRAFEPSAWEETAWTALAHGATGLAYFGLPAGEALAPLVGLHDEAARIGPWLAAAPRRPAPVAVLASWTTRTAGDAGEVKRHDACVGSRFSDLAVGFEEVDYLLEEQLGSPPAALQAIVLSAVPRLSQDSLKALHRFVARGGHLFAEKTAASLDETGTRRSDPWAPVRGTGRIHDLAPKLSCSPARPSKRLGREWRSRLAELGIRPRSHTPGDRSEARLLGGKGIYYWILLNHGVGAATVRGRTRLGGGRLHWRDLRSGDRVQLPHGRELRIERDLPARAAAVLVGVERPAETMEMTLLQGPHQVTVELQAVDGQGRPVADGYPLRLTGTDGAGSALLPPAARSRVAVGGKAVWTVPIPLDLAPGEWTLRGEEPVGGRSVSQNLSLFEDA
ncbi:MAG: hypothetical protein CL910_09355 [Deltaproteobacteria bacterium]|nr:hypothetical protein [Deltaproteobacteria bacterium]